MISDQKLIRKIVKRESQEAAEILIKRYYDNLYSFLFRQIDNKEDSLDMTQEVFIVALNSLASYQPKKASFKTWLFRIGTYKVIDSRRKRQAIYEELEDGYWNGQEDVSEQIIDQELLNEINEFITKFKPEVQEVFRLRIYAELSFRDISQLLDENEEKVKAQYYRLSKKIKEAYLNEFI
ncbi:RNA polymerase sigma factor [Vagococcus sp.]|uniref:RNA polymerase sigma factor n=1 Tax=Vagococcus sp. TaxID=1933889 RepID=UPI002FC89A58